MIIYSNLAAKLTPLTSSPFQRGYSEYQPCAALKPYVRCFWGTDGAVRASRVVIPDVCADIIFTKGNAPIFCGVSDTPFTSEIGAEETFGIRFYAWTAALFSEDSLRETLNTGTNSEQHFTRIVRELSPLLFAVGTTEERIAIAESCLLKNMRERRSGIFTEAVGEILEHRGCCTADSLSRTLHISGRQLERIFKEYAGITPKKLSSIVRYQNVWRDLLFGENFNAADKALEYGYVDQSHMLNDFRRFHSMSFRQARDTAFADIKEHNKYVAFLQDAAGRQ